MGDTVVSLLRARSGFFDEAILGALEGNFATTRFLNAYPYLAIPIPYRPLVHHLIEATTILTQGEIDLTLTRFLRTIVLKTVSFPWRGFRQ